MIMTQARQVWSLLTELYPRTSTLQLNPFLIAGRHPNVAGTQAKCNAVLQKKLSPQ